LLGDEDVVRRSARRRREGGHGVQFSLVALRSHQ